MDSLIKILLIDGDQLIGNTIKTALAPRKYKVICASTCISGMLKVFQHHPDLILYNTNLDPSDGSEVFKALQLTSPFSHIRVVFYKNKNEAEIKNLINNNCNEAAIKSQHPNEPVQLVENKIKGLKNDDNGVSYDFNTLFHLSPNGMLIFDKNGLIAINQMLISLLKRKVQDVSKVKLDDLFERTSLQAIKQWMKNYLKGENSPFSNQVILINRTGESIPMNLTIYELKQTERSAHFLGFLQAIQGNNLLMNYHLAADVCNLLKKENIEVSEALEKKIIYTLKLRTNNNGQQKKSFFTKREDEVLRLSMEGLSIKVIADKLSLSTRTIERYRTQLMEKSGAKNIVEVIVFSIKNNLVKI